MTTTLATYTYTIPGKEKPLSLWKHYRSLATLLKDEGYPPLLYQRLEMKGLDVRPRKFAKKKDIWMQRHLSKDMSHPDRQKFNYSGITQTG